MSLDYAALNTEEQIAALTQVAQEALAQYGFKVVELENINHEYNSTFAVVTEGQVKYALRININSGRSAANIAAETFFLKHLAAAPGVNVVTPVANLAAEYRTSIRSEQLDQTFDCLVFNWLEGEEIAEGPTDAQLEATGALMAHMHLAMQGVTLPSGADLPMLDDLFWGSEDQLLKNEESFSAEDALAISTAKQRVENVIAELYATEEPRIIHADMHGWNLMWHDGELTVFDFDDCGIGLRVQDLGVTLYYLDNDDQREAVLRGYAKVAPLPAFTKHQMDALLLHRRLQLLNYLYESKTPEHREMIPKYQTETLRRIAVFLEGNEG